MELILDRVTRQFGQKLAVDSFCAALHTGVYGLLGANGAGKTTLMRLICGVQSPTSGEIRLDGTPIEQLGAEYRARLGYLPQNFGYYPGFTAEDFMLYLSAVKGLPKAFAREQAGMLLEQVGLYGERKRKIRTFSGGMKQRLGTAQALLGNPEILVLDEPTAGLDPKERIRLRNLISDYGKNRLVLLSTHIVSDIEYIADEILVMKGGRLLHQGTQQEILRAVENKVWECSVSSQEAQRLSRRYPLANQRREGEAILLRLISAQPPCPSAKPAVAGLEDLYLYYFSDDPSVSAWGKEGDGRDAVV